jgi:hypothetical protein
MNRFFGQSKSTRVPQPTLNDTAATLDSRVETINKQIASVDQGLIYRNCFNLINISLF